MRQPLAIITLAALHSTIQIMEVAVKSHEQQSKKLVSIATAFTLPVSHTNRTLL